MTSKPHSIPPEIERALVELGSDPRAEITILEADALREYINELLEQFETLRAASEYAYGWLAAGDQRDQDVAAQLKVALAASNPASMSESA